MSPAPLHLAGPDEKGAAVPLYRSSAAAREPQFPIGRLNAPGLCEPPTPTRRAARPHAAMRPLGR